MKKRRKKGGKERKGGRRKEERERKRDEKEEGREAAARCVCGPRRSVFIACGPPAVAAVTSPSSLFTHGSDVCSVEEPAFCLAIYHHNPSSLWRDAIARGT